MTRVPPGRDVGRVWDLAVQLQRALAASGPRLVNAGTASQPHWVDRGEALVALYARRLLVEFEADRARLAAVGAACRWREMHARRRWVGRPTALGADRRPGWSRWWRWEEWVRAGQDRAHVWSAATRVSKTAAFWAAHAGSDDSRARLLGAQRALMHHDCMGGWLPADAPQMLSGTARHPVD